MRTNRRADAPDRTARFDADTVPSRLGACMSAAPCACRGHTVIDRGVDVETGVVLIEECSDC